MAESKGNQLAQVVRQNEAAILEEWTRLQLSAAGRRSDLMDETQLREESRSILGAVAKGIESGDLSGEGSEWADLRAMLARISRARAHLGFSPIETATFVLSLKEPIFNQLQRDDSQSALETVWSVTKLIDRLALITTELYQKSREEIIQRQQQELLELSTPVVSLWHGIVALPVIGTLDSARTQIVMENLLQRIVEKEAQIAIIDITGVPTVDTLVAQHLLKTVAAARLMGADCIISGIRPQIAQTIVHLGVNLEDVITKATLADAFLLALTRTGQRIVAAGERD
jgi:rsbT co-antagonist protein RsbR